MREGLSDPEAPRLQAQQTQMLTLPAPQCRAPEGKGVWGTQALAEQQDGRAAMRRGRPGHGKVQGPAGPLRGWERHLDLQEEGWSLTGVWGRAWGGPSSHGSRQQGLVTFRGWEKRRSQRPGGARWGGRSGKGGPAIGHGGERIT